MTVLIVVGVAILVVVLALLRSLHSIGAAEVGLVTKRLGRRLDDGQLVALSGEAGYQAELLMPGLRFKLWPLFGVERYPWVLVAPDHVGLVVAQVGESLPTGAQSPGYKPESGGFSDPHVFLANGGQRGVQRPVLPPGSTAPIHPVGFVVITSDRVFGK